MTIWTFPEHPWPEEKTIRWSGEPDDIYLACLLPGGRRRWVVWVEGCPVFNFYDYQSDTFHTIEGWELDGEKP